MIDGFSAWIACLACAVLGCVLMLGFTMGEHRIKADILRYGCETVQKTWTH